MSTAAIPMERPLLPLGCALCAGIALGYGWPAHRVLGAFVSAGCLAWIAWGIRHERPALMTPLLLFFSLGYLLIQPWAAPRFPPDDITHYVGKGPSLIVGQIDTLPVTAGYCQKFFLRVLFVESGHHRRRATGRLRVTLSGDTPVLSRNDRVRFRGYVRLLHNFNNPGGFDYKRYMAAQGVWASVYVPKGALRVLGPGGAQGGWHPMDRARDRIAAFLEERAHAETRGILKTLLMGDRQDLAPETRQAFQKSGIGHLLAISGLHVGIVGGGVFTLAAWILGFFPGLLWRGWVRPAAAAVAVTGVWGYGILAGMSPSTQRAVLMMSIFFLTFFSGRSHDILNTLAAAAIGIVAFHPPAIGEASFQLSFSAVTAIILGLGVYGCNRPGTDRGFRAGWQRKLSAFCLVSLCATLGTLPLVMCCFHQVSLVGLPANLLFVPLIGFCVLPLGLGAVCLLPASGLLAGALLWPADRLLSACLVLVKKIAAWPFSSIMTIIPSGFEIVGYYVVAVLLVIYLRSSGESREPATPLAAAARRRFWLWTTAVCLLALSLDAGYWSWQRFWCGQLRVTVVDVGNGTANILELPGGKTLLIDGGGFSDNAVFDVGKNIVAPILLRNKILSLEEIILSHPDSDHLNGLVYIAGHFRVGRLRSNGEKADTKGYHDLMRTVRQRRIRVFDGSAAAGYERINGVLLKFLYPPVNFKCQMAIEAWRRNANNDSLVVQVCFGQRVFLFPGDIEQEVERELVKIVGDGLRSDVLVAPHHGSPTSGIVAFIEKVSPRTVVFSTGAFHGRRRPGRQVRARYAAFCDRIFTTAENGAVLFSTDGYHLSQRAMIEEPLPESL
jgi:competence protein ComEC